MFNVQRCSMWGVGCGMIGCLFGYLDVRRLDDRCSMWDNWMFVCSPWDDLMWDDWMLVWIFRCSMFDAWCACRNADRWNSRHVNSSNCSRYCSVPPVGPRWMWYGMLSMWDVWCELWDNFDTGSPMWDDRTIECPMWDLGLMWDGFVEMSFVGCSDYWMSDVRWVRCVLLEDCSFNVQQCSRWDEMLDVRCCLSNG
jgi:hypothetical protein